MSYNLVVPCNFISVSRCWVYVLGQVLVAGFRSFFSPVCVFPFVFHHNPWTPSSLAVFPLYPSNPSPCHLICYTYLHCLHLSIAVATTFARIVFVLSSNSESVLKTGLVFAYKLGFRHSIYQNRSEKNFGSVHPHLWWVWKFLIWSKTGHKINFSWSQAFC